MPPRSLNNPTSESIVDIPSGTLCVLHSSVLRCCIVPFHFVSTSSGPQAEYTQRHHFQSSQATTAALYPTIIHTFSNEALTTQSIHTPPKVTTLNRKAWACPKLPSCLFPPACCVMERGGHTIHRLHAHGWPISWVSHQHRNATQWPQLDVSNFPGIRPIPQQASQSHFLNRCAKHHPRCWGEVRGTSGLTTAVTSSSGQQHDAFLPCRRPRPGRSELGPSWRTISRRCSHDPQRYFGRPSWADG